jgi:hypothetical protein
MLTVMTAVTVMLTVMLTVMTAVTVMLTVMLTVILTVMILVTVTIHLVHNLEALSRCIKQKGYGYNTLCFSVFHT